MSQNQVPALSTKMAHAIRFLTIDAVEKAKSGHPGAPMGMAEIATVLWRRHLQHNPANPGWLNRDRFVLSNGHGSMLIYALLHLSGYELSIDDLKNFRQLHSKTPGHPEVGVTAGVETTTGPLGQGIANSVGMALAERLLAQEFNQDEFKVVDHFTYAFMGDGCLMEGISHEVASLAGILGLSKLIWLYDDNGISIDGDVKHWFADDTPARFRAYGWNVIADVDGHDMGAIDQALLLAKAQANSAGGKPTLICCKTVIGQGAPNKAGGHDVHGSPLGASEIDATRQALGWSHAPFEVPSDVMLAWNCKSQGMAIEAQWQKTFDAYSATYPQRATELKRRMAQQLPEQFALKCNAVIASFADTKNEIATRKASQNVLDALAPVLPEFFGGSADLTGSNLTNFKACTLLRGQSWGNHLSYGVREFGMAAIMNGIALHGGYLPYGGTFLTFSDYSRNAIRMAALMKQRVIHVFTHDSIGLGEDGPTHQSIEHVPSLRLIPFVDVWRPADQTETAVSWVESVRRLDGPSALILTRQNLPQLSIGRGADIARGGYVLREVVDAKITLIATGSEVSLAINAADQLQQNGIAARVVSMPCTSVFDRQDETYRRQVLGSVPRVAIEAAQPDFWHKYVGCDTRMGRVMGITTFGESAPAKDLFAYFKLTTKDVVHTVTEIVSLA